MCGVACPRESVSRVRVLHPGADPDLNPEVEDEVLRMVLRCRARVRVRRGNGHESVYRT